MLAMKDSASFVHTLLHCIPNNPWHQHAPVSHKHTINPLEIHTYLQQKHVHTHEHTAHNHTHDVMDHIHADDTTEESSSLPQIKTDLTIDLFVQSYTDFSIQQNNTPFLIKHFPFYFFARITHSLFPPFQPPQA